MYQDSRKRKEDEAMFSCRVGSIMVEDEMEGQYCFKKKKGYE